jgi:hypothetical protein
LDLLFERIPQDVTLGAHQKVLFHRLILQFGQPLKNVQFQEIQGGMSANVHA